MMKKNIENELKMRYVIIKNVVITIVSLTLVLIGFREPKCYYWFKKLDYECLVPNYFFYIVFASMVIQLPLYLLACLLEKRNMETISGFVKFIAVFALRIVVVSVGLQAYSIYSTIGVLIFTLAPGCIDLIGLAGYGIIIFADKLIDQNKTAKEQGLRMSFLSKLLQVVVQALNLIPAAIITGVFATFAIPFCSFFWLPEMVGSIYLREIKRGDWEKGFSYNVGASDTIKYEKVEHAIMDANHNKVGSYTTNEAKVVHDSGYRYDFSYDEKMLIVYTGLNIFFRLASLFLAIVALLIPGVHVRMTRPKNIKPTSYKTAPFNYLDLIIFE